MKAEILSIGTELLVGSIVNTNARFISEALAHNAIDVYRQTTVGDNVGRIMECLEEALRRADLVVVSGGLGPTEDDVTVESVAQVLGKPLRPHRPTYRHILARLQKRQLRMTRLISKQCRVPEGAVVLKNLEGTAPGLVCQTERAGQKKWLLVLPGPPRELNPLLLKALPVFFQLAKLKKEHFLIRSVRITGLLEAQVAQKVTDLLKLKPPVTVGIYAKPGEVELKIMVKASTHARALRNAEHLEREIKKRLGSYAFGRDSDTVASKCGELLRKKKKTLSVAESCTGGVLGGLITSVPGSSDYFKGGTLAYSNKVKKEKLGIEENVLKKYGAVSPQTAKRMASGARKAFGTDYALAVTGIAGPGGGSKKKPVGLVYVALADKNGATCGKNFFLGTREEIRLQAAQKALYVLWLKLKNLS